MWISQTNENCQGQSDCQSPKKTRTQTVNYRVGLGFPKSIRILSKYFFQRVFKRGTRWSGSFVLFQYVPSDSHSRLGITVSKKYGKAHDRNRFKRVVREAFREAYSQIPRGLHIHVSPKLPLRPITKQDVLKDFFCCVSAVQELSASGSGSLKQKSGDSTKNKI